jgi:hypothetical protein
VRVVTGLSGGAAVFVDETAEDLDAFNVPKWAGARVRWLGWRDGWLKIVAAVRAGRVVVSQVGGEYLA